METPKLERCIYTECIRMYVRCNSPCGFGSVKYSLLNLLSLSWWASDVVDISTSMPNVKSAGFKRDTRGTHKQGYSEHRDCIDSGEWRGPGTALDTVSQSSALFSFYNVSRHSFGPRLAARLAKNSWPCSEVDTCHQSFPTATGMQPPGCGASESSAVLTGSSLPRGLKAGTGHM